MSKSNATEVDLLAKVFKATALPWDAETDLQIHLHVADPGEAGTTATSPATYTSYVFPTFSEITIIFYLFLHNHNPYHINLTF